MIAKKHGFTLLELLVSAGVLSLVSVIIAQVLFTTVKLNTTTERLKEMKQTGTASMETIRRMIQNARNVTSSCTGVQSEITIVGIDGGETILQCLVDEKGIYRIASQSVTMVTPTPPPAYLTSSNVTLVNAEGVAGCGSSLQFECSSVGDKVTSVSILFMLRQQNSTTGTFEGNIETFQSTGTIRNN
jgi:prepilin-type N-terminal cleavage/methylation domain-containing protein